MPATHFCVRVTACGVGADCTHYTQYRAAPRPPLATYVQTVLAHLHFVLVEQQVGDSLLDKEAAAIQWTHQCTFLQAHLQVKEQQIKSVLRQIFDRSRCPHVQGFRLPSMPRRCSTVIRLPCRMYRFAHQPFEQRRSSMQPCLLASSCSPAAETIAPA